LQRLDLTVSNSDFGLRHANDDGASARQFLVGNFGDEFKFKAKPLGLLTSHIVKKINDISTKSIFDSPTFIEIEGAGGIHFQSIGIADCGAKLALEFQRSLPHLRHGESYDVV
jgi:hypothetical protein